jgi:hypothetical protein
MFKNFFQIFFLLGNRIIVGHHFLGHALPVCKGKKIFFRNI